jgi:hypothetical protein
MLVSPFEDEHRFFGRTNWILQTARSCRQAEIVVAISFVWLRWKSKRRIESRVPVIGQEAARAMAGAGYSGL